MNFLMLVLVVLIFLGIFLGTYLVGLLYIFEMNLLVTVRSVSIMLIDLFQCIGVH